MKRMIGMRNETNRNLTINVNGINEKNYEMNKIYFPKMGIISNQALFVLPPGITCCNAIIEDSYQRKMFGPARCVEAGTRLDSFVLLK